MYLGTSPSYPSIVEALDGHDIGLMCQPGTNHPRSGWIWAADNGCFSDKWDEWRWFSWLLDRSARSGCLFATVPDVVGDHAATMARWDRYAFQVRELHYPLAFVAQDGATVGSVPWHELDTLFVGGTDGFKLGSVAKELMREAKDRGKWVHIGRINSQRRYLAFAALGADSCDGTYLSFGPDTNLPNLLGWLRHHKTQLTMFEDRA